MQQNEINIVEGAGLEFMWSGIEHNVIEMSNPESVEKCQSVHSGEKGGMVRSVSFKMTINIICSFINLTKYKIYVTMFVCYPML